MPDDTDAPLPSSITVTLRTPIITHAGSQTTLVIKAPKARDLIALKQSPHDVYADGRFSPRHDMMAKLLEALTGVDASAIEDLTVADFNTAATVVRAYLAEAGNTPAIFLA